MCMQKRLKINIHPYTVWLTLALLNPAFTNSVDSKQFASSEANWYESTLFAIKYVSLYEQSGSNNLAS